MINILVRTKEKAPYIISMEQLNNSIFLFRFVSTSFNFQVYKNIYCLHSTIIYCMIFHSIINSYRVSIFFHFRDMQSIVIFNIRECLEVRIILEKKARSFNTKFSVYIRQSQQLEFHNL